MQTFIGSRTATMRLDPSHVLTIDKKGNPFSEPGVEDNLILECAHMLEQLYPDKVIMLCQKHHTVFKYAGGNSTDLWGYSKEALESFSIDDLLGIIHIDDVSHVKWGLSKLHECSKDSPAETKAIFTYRARTVEGEYITIHDEKVCVRTSAGSFAYFNIYSKSKDQKGPVKFEIYKRIAGNRMIKIYEFVSTNDSIPFSNRELEIIKLLDKGLDNMGIAQVLSLSVFTVKNHKQNMFKKANVKNSLELTRFARSINVL
jgi:DNA-binding CsgD family transcriptional regulator